MTTYRTFHAQLASIMEALTRAAVAEICELVDDGYAALQLEISRSRDENAALRRKLELIEGIVARGHRGGGGGGGGAMLGDAGAGLMELSLEQVSSAVDLQLRGSARKRGGRSWAMMAPAEDPLVAAEEEPNDGEVVLIKEEEEEAEPASGELFLNDDGMEAQPSPADDSQEGPSGMAAAASLADTKPWEREGDGGAPERAELPRSHSAPGSPGAADGAGDDSSDVVFDLASESDCEVSAAAPPTRKPLLLSAGSPASSCDLKHGVSLMSSLPYDSDPELCSSWSNQGLPSMVPVSHQQYLKPDHRQALMDKASDLNGGGGGGFPLALSLAASRLDPLELNRYCRDRRFVCSYCGKGFTSSRSLETHVRVHTGERPYSCAQCGKRFTQSGHLKTHQSVHTGERPFACQHCGKRFAGKQNMRIHQQKHHPPEPGAAPL